MKLRMDGFKTFVFIISLLIGIQISYGSPISCMEVYDQGGVSAVLQSPECSYWFHPNQSQAMNCQFASIKGLYDFDETHVSCNVDMQIPFTGINGTEYVKVGVFGIFDSIIGREASDMASKLLLDYFVAHTVYLSSKVPLVYNQEKVTGYKNFHGEGESLKSNLNATSHATGKPLTIEESTHTRILKEALLRTIQDIESTFLKEALEKELFRAGTTATVAVLVDGQILVANIGNSKAFLCSRSINSRNVTQGLIAKEMTQDHYLTREDERARYEAAGGDYIIFDLSGKIKLPRGSHWMSRAIGHLEAKSFGVIAEPEITDWQPLAPSDTYMILQTYQVTRKMGTPQDVCDLLSGQQYFSPKELSLAEFLVSYAAYRKLKPLPCPHHPYSCKFTEEMHQGKGREYSAIVVPLLSSGFLQHPSGNCGPTTLFWFSTTSLRPVIVVVVAYLFVELVLVITYFLFF